jgi:hypothetical protein
MSKSNLVKKAVEQIVKDLEKGDQTAIVELLNTTPADALERFLSEVE